MVDLVTLSSSQWWTSGRKGKDVIRMPAGSDIVVAAVDRTSDRFVGFARVISDFTYVALILDVIVAPEFQGCGIGAKIMESVVTHPRLAGVRSLELVCQPDVVGFYGRCGYYRGRVALFAVRQPLKGRIKESRLRRLAIRPTPQSSLGRRSRRRPGRARTSLRQGPAPRWSA